MKFAEELVYVMILVLHEVVAVEFFVVANVVENAVERYKFFKEI